MKTTCISIVNYNGNKDTYSCISCIMGDEIFKDSTIFILDNHSDFDQVCRLEKYIQNLSGIRKYVGACEDMLHLSGDYDIVLIKSNQNLGFAKGNNFILDLSIALGYDYSVLINNDTSYEGSSIRTVIKLLDSHLEIGAATLGIEYYWNPGHIWNAGGKIFFGYKKYFTTKYIQNKRKQGFDYIDTQFMSGCFIAVRNKIIEKYGTLSERFFFGEEDYEFSYRMKKNGVKCVSVIGATIYHKVNQSLKKIENLQGRILVYDLNKLIDMKYSMGKVKFVFFRLSYQCVIYLRFLRMGKLLYGYRYIRKLMGLVKNHSCVDAKLTFRLWNEGKEI